MERNRFKERCSKCGDFIEPRLGIITKIDLIYKVFHTNCLQVLPEKKEEVTIKILDPSYSKYHQYILDNQRYFKVIVINDLKKYFQMEGGKAFLIARDLFYDCLLILSEKYLDDGKLVDEKHCKYVFRKICKIQTMKLISRKIDEAFLARNGYQSNLILPSQIYNREYCKKWYHINKDSFNEKRRLNYSDVEKEKRHKRYLKSRPFLSINKQTMT